MSEKKLTEMKCVPCRGGAEPLKGQVIHRMAEEISKGWKVVNEHHLEREFNFRNFREALDFVNKVGKLAESQGHHPDIYLTWGKVKISIWTHKINGLHSNDFILAAKIDEL